MIKRRATMRMKEIRERDRIVAFRSGGLHRAVDGQGLVRI